MRKYSSYLLAAASAIAFSSCENLDDFIGGSDDDGMMTGTEINFKVANSFSVGGEGAAEISAFDPSTDKLFIVNVEVPEISVYDLSDIDNPIQLNSISTQLNGAPNSLDINNGRLAVAVEADNKQRHGAIEVYDTTTQNLLNSYEVGALPDMVTFTPNGQMLVCAGEGEPNDDYTDDPHGTVGIIDLTDGTTSILDFTAFNGQEAALEAQGFRVFGPGATLARDVEPEYVAVSDDSQTAWVAMQENNGLAVVDLSTKTITQILPLGYKDYSLPGNEIDPSDRDDKTELRSVPAFGIYHPDAIAYYSVNGMDYIISANEGDAREYEGTPGFVEEDRVKDVTLDPTVFPDAATLQLDENLGRLKLTLVQGDIDNDGDYDEIYSFGARSFSIWSGGGQLVYDSGNDIAEITLAETPSIFNGEDGRSDDKGAEPESVVVKKIGDKQILFVGLERNNQILVFDVSNPSAPEYIQLLSNGGDVGPEGLFFVSAGQSPNGKDLLIVSNEVSGTVTIYEN